MGRVVAEISMSLDGYVAGPDPTLEEPLGRGGELLHEWSFSARAWRERHGGEGGEDSADSRLIEETIGNVGASIMGRRMFSGGSGPGGDDPKADAWGGDEPPFRHPVFILTHHEREQVTKPNGTTYNFVTDGIEPALEQARAAAGEGSITVAGGADAIDQYVAAGLVDELRIHVAPILLGGGTRLFGRPLEDAPRRIESTRTIESASGVAHLTYELR